METAEQFLKDRYCCDKLDDILPIPPDVVMRLLEKFAEKQASFISSKQDVIKSVCEDCGRPDLEEGKKLCQNCEFDKEE